MVFGNFNLISMILAIAASPERPTKKRNFRGFDKNELCLT